jgi:hypothetical protein
MKQSKSLLSALPTARNLVGLANHEVYLKMMVDRARTPPPELDMPHMLPHPNAA